MSTAEATSLNKQLEAAMAAHSMWKHRLNSMVETGKTDIDPATATRNDACEFGKWLKGYQPGAKEKAAFESVRAKHTAFHECVGKIVTLAVTGRADEAKKSMALGSVYAKLSAELTMELLNWRKLAG